MQNLRFLSFASDQIFRDQAYQLLNSLEKIYIGSTSFVYTPNELPSSLVKYADHNPKGYGYWIWKSYIIANELRNTDTESVIVYLDSRFKLKSQNQSIYWLDSFVNNPRYEIALWQTTYQELIWTKKYVLEYFNLNENSKECLSGQFAGGLSAWKKTYRTILHADSMFMKINKNKQLINDHISRYEYKCFKEHRHDQSVMSLLTKVAINAKKLDVFIINNENLYSDNILPWQIQQTASQLWRQRYFKRWAVYIIKRLMKELLKTIKVSKKAIVMMAREQK